MSVLVLPFQFGLPPAKNHPDTLRKHSLGRWRPEEPFRQFRKVPAQICKFRRMPPCAVKICAVRPVFTWAVGELPAADPSKCGSFPENFCSFLSSGPLKTKFDRTRKIMNINILGGTVSGTNRGCPWDKRNPSLEQIGTRPWDKPAVFCLFTSTVKSPFCPVCPWDGWGFVPETIVPQGPSEKCLCVFRLLFFPTPKQSSTVCLLGALYRQVDLQGVFVKIGDFIKFKGFLVEFLENRRS